jgi:hypothetical protein
MMRHLCLPISEGSEDNITSHGEWKSKHTWTSSEESIPKRPSPPPHGKGHIEEEEKEEEEEEEEEDADVEGEENEAKMANKAVQKKSDDSEWNSDDENVLNIKDLDTDYGSITFLGFHPYKEVVFLGLTSLVGVAYHLKTSKVQYLGKMRPKDYDSSPTNDIYESFPYTPCMIGELLKHASEGPRRYRVF